ncbi:YceI family protein [Mucilaginibacter antarcticus]|uniref:YceI family protein n=1 Tax=Mucilaginibacter antarcticus TaxID=1855725 RepID=A0ABW5XN29_9SPHI
MKQTNNPLAAIRFIIAAIILLAAPQLVMAQVTYKLADGADTYLKVSGTSNIHDWTMTSSSLESQGTFVKEGDDLSAIRAFTFQFAIKTLKSEHSSMDSRMNKAVNASKYPTVSYKLTSVTVTNILKGKYLLKTKGDLTFAGNTQAISMDVTAKVNADNTITCSGTKKIQLTDYGIKPPSYMLGTMKVYNDLTIQFNLIYKK